MVLNSLTFSNSFIVCKGRNNKNMICAEMNRQTTFHDPWENNTDDNDQQRDQPQTFHDPNQEFFANIYQFDTSKQEPKVDEIVNQSYYSDHFHDPIMNIYSVQSFDESLSHIDKTYPSEISNEDFLDTDTIPIKNSAHKLTDDHSSDRETADMTDDDISLNKHRLENIQWSFPTKTMEEEMKENFGMEIPSSITKTTRELRLEEMSKKQVLHLSKQMEMQDVSKRYHSLNKTGKIMPTGEVFTRTTNKNEIKKNVSKSKKKEKNIIIRKLSSGLENMCKASVKKSIAKELPDLV